MTKSRVNALHGIEFHQNRSRVPGFHCGWKNLNGFELPGKKLNGFELLQNMSRAGFQFICNDALSNCGGSQCLGAIPSY